jgi:hypothetical protein
MEDEMKKFIHAFYVMIAGLLIFSSAANATSCDQCSQPYPKPPAKPNPAPRNPANLIFTNGPIQNLGIAAVGSVIEKTVTVTNVGQMQAELISADGSHREIDFKGHRFPGEGGTCTSELGINSSCTIVLAFSPKSNGHQTETLRIRYDNDPYDRNQSKQVITLQLSGYGAEPAHLTFKDGSAFDFGQVQVGWAVDRIFWIENAGEVDATSMSGGFGSSSFSFKNGSYPGTGGTCGTTLGSTQMCSVVVTFAPYSTGSESNFVGLEYNNGARNHEWVSCQLTGSGQK